MLAAKAGEMSAFEAFCWKWYQRNMPQAMEAGLMGRMLDKFGMGEVQERFFLRAWSAIRQLALRIQAADAGK